MSEIPHEALTARGFRGLFLPERPTLARAAWALVTNQLPDGDATALASQIAEEIEAERNTVWGSIPAPAPDVVFETCGVVRAVIEWKNGRKGAAWNSTSWPEFEALPERSDATSARLREELRGIPDNERTYKIKKGIKILGLSQLDAYYVGGWNERAKLGVTSPEDVLWLLFDLDGRPVDEAFDGSARTGDKWHSVDVRPLLVGLNDGALRETFTRDEQDAVALFTGLLFMFAREVGLTGTAIPSQWIAELGTPSHDA